MQSCDSLLTAAHNACRLAATTTNYQLAKPLRWHKENVGKDQLHAGHRPHHCLIGMIDSTSCPQLKHCSTARALTCAGAIDALPAWEAAPAGALPKSVLPTRTPEAALSEAASWSLAADVNDSCRAGAQRTLPADAGQSPQDTDR